MHSQRNLENILLKFNRKVIKLVVKMLKDGRSETANAQNTDLPKNDSIERKNLKIQYILAGLTVVVLIVNSIQTYISNQAVLEARNANNLTKEIFETSKVNDANTAKANKEKDNIDKLKDSISRDNVRKSLEIAKQNADASTLSANAVTQSLEISKNTLKAYQQKNEIEKRSIELEFQSDLTIKTATITKWNLNEKIDGFCEFTTRGKLPIKVDSSFHAMFFSSPYSHKQIIDSPKNNQFTKLGKLIANTVHIDKDRSSYFEPFTYNVMVDKEIHERLLSGWLHLIYYGKIIYENPVNGKKRYFLYLVEVLPSKDTRQPFPNSRYTEIFMENGDIK